MAEENKNEVVAEAEVEAKVEEKRSGVFGFVRNHPYLFGTVGALVAGYIGLRLASEPFSEVSYAEVLKEINVPTGANSSAEGEKSNAPGHYTLLVKVDERLEEKTEQKELEEKTYERICRFYISENKDMPVAVLDDMIHDDPDGKEGPLKGSRIFIRYFTQKMPFSKPHSRYGVGCHDVMESNHIRVVSVDETLEEAQKSLEGTIKKEREEELRRARMEAQKLTGGRRIMY